MMFAWISSGTLGRDESFDSSDIPFFTAPFRLLVSNTASILMDSPHLIGFSGNDDTRRHPPHDTEIFERIKGAIPRLEMQNTA